MSIVQKIYRVGTKVIDAERGLVEITASTASVDRDNEAVNSAAWTKRLDTYKKHPVLLSSHDYKSLRNQIGEVRNVAVNAQGQLTGIAEYYIGKGNEEADWGFNLAQRGMAAYSVGFIPHSFERGKGAGSPGVIYTDVELLEISQVTVPSNREALQRLSVKGVGDPVIQEMARELWEDTQEDDATYTATEDGGIKRVFDAEGVLKLVEIPIEKCGDMAIEAWHRKASQEVASYDPLGGTPANACANCLFFISPNRCSVVEDWPVAISPTGLSKFWTTIPDVKPTPLEVVIVGREPAGVAGVVEASVSQKAPWDTSYVNDLPDNAFAVILPGGEKDDEGKTVPRDLRKLPHHNANGDVDLPHLRNALAREPQADMSQAEHDAAQAHLDAHAKAEDVGSAAEKGWDWVRASLDAGTEIPKDILIGLSGTAVTSGFLQVAGSATLGTATTVTNGSSATIFVPLTSPEEDSMLQVEKAGKRNSSADMQMMESIRGRLASAMNDLMNLMGTESTEEDANTMPGEGGDMAQGQGEGKSLADIISILDLKEIRRNALQDAVNRLTAGNGG